MENESSIVVQGKTMMYIPGGTYRMGSSRGYGEELPVHEVAVAPFYMILVDCWIIKSLTAWCENASVN